MKEMDAVQKRLLEEVADLHDIPEGAYNFRANGESVDRRSTKNIEIESKTDKSGIDIRIKSGTKNESVHIPVVLSASGIKETVYNDFFIGDDCDVLIVAGCGIDNCGSEESSHDGVHTFFVGKNAKVKYVEKHYGCGCGTGGRVMNPKTVVKIDEGGYMEMESVQIKGIDSTNRVTIADLEKDATFVVTERLMTHGDQLAISNFEVNLNGENSGTHVVSRAVARDNSNQQFIAKMYGNAACNGHSECDAIIMDNAKISAIPEIKANSVDASMIHEAAIGKIAGDQLIKLMTLGLTAAEAEEQIINGFLK